MAAAQTAETMEMSEVWPDTYGEEYIYEFKPEPLTKFTSSSRTEFKDILPRNIFQMITNTILISRRIVISYVMKRGILFWVYWKVNGKWDDNMIRISQWRESHCRTNSSVRRKKQIQKCQSGIQEGKLLHSWQGGSYSPPLFYDFPLSRNPRCPSLS